VAVPAFFAAMWVGYPLLALALGLGVTKALRNRQVGFLFAYALGLGLSALILGIPFADYPSKKRTFDARCARDAGLHILRTVADVEGVHGIQNAIDYGYSYGELYRDPKSKTGLKRYYKPTQPYKTYLVQNAAETSQYGYRWFYSRVDDVTTRSESQTYLTTTGEVLGRSVSYSMSPVHGNNDPSIIVKLFHAARQPWLEMHCPNDSVPNTRTNLKALLNGTLLPRSH